MSIEQDQYKAINEILGNLRKNRLKKSRGYITKNHFFKDHQIQIYQENERSFRSYISEIEDAIFNVITNNLKTSEFNRKTVIELDAGCGLLGILLSLAGANVTFACEEENIPILNKNLRLNDFVSESKSYENIFKFAWDEDLAGDGTCFDYIITGSQILDYVDEETIENIIKKFVQYSGNGTTLIFGYHLSKHNSSQMITFREKLSQYFDIRNAKQFLCKTTNGEIFVLLTKRKPFSTYFEYNK